MIQLTEEREPTEPFDVHPGTQSQPSVSGRANAWRATMS